MYDRRNAQQRLAQRGAYYPSVSADFSATRQGQSGVIAPTLASNALAFNLFTPEVTVSYVPDVFGLNRRTVESAQVIMDRDTGRSKGFGFVEMKTDQEAQAAIAALNGKDAGGRTLTVNEARPKTEGGGRGGPRGHGGGYGGGRRY